ncbi:hypothetical protein Ct9H90mP29_05520 [bacterium]|nr:MAG: hypothetical protein Ct9H90mP29_05520 [bacterium]
MVPTYVFLSTFPKYEWDGDVLDANEMINMTSVETSFFILI